MGTTIYYVATELKRIYLEDTSQTSETAKYIRSIKEDAENTKDDQDRRDKEVIANQAIYKYIKKRIENANRAFEKDTTVLKVENDKDAEIILPKPTFKIFEYNRREIVNFFKAYIEESDRTNDKNGKVVSSRKAKYIYDYNVSLDKKFDFVYRVLQHDFIKPQTFSKINYNFNEKYNEIRSRIQFDVKKELMNNDIYDLPNGKLYRRYEDILKNGEMNCARYMIKLAIMWLCNCTGVKCGMVFEDVPWGEKGKFRILWKLWMWIWMQTVQYLVLEKIDTIDDKDLCGLKNKVKSLEANIDQEMKPVNKSDGIFKDYFMYNFLLVVRDETIKDAEIQQSVFMKKGNKHYDLPEELSFVRKDNEQKELVDDINESTMQKYFDFGDKKCSPQIFKERIYFCEKFIKTYNSRSGRALNYNDRKTQRAVYRAFYVDEIKVNRRKLVTIAKDIIKKDSYEGIFTEHYVLGNTISDELLTEFYQGERVLKIKNDVVPLIYSIGLKVFYRYFPRQVRGSIDFQKSLNILEFYFTETLDAVYESFYK